MQDREKLVDELFAEAVGLEPAERWKFFAAYARDGARADICVVAEVEALLADYRRAEAAEFMRTPLVSADIAEPTPTLSVGQEIEGYKILRFVAEGGMGEVYLAEETALKREVALKLIKSNLKNKEVLRRFINEREILANLQHPNIARLLSAGATQDGQPFFIMEYVAGRPLDEYAAAHNLSLAERLKLFRAVCAGVACAHQHLIVHRDIKPSNILVTEDGTPKLLDFGIAKLLDPAQTTETPLVTATVMRAMTPEYASPEQVRGEPVTTATDIYSLGVLLYELLAGRRPYRFKSTSPDEIARVICTVEPERPSTASGRSAETGAADARATDTAIAKQARRRLRGDLDNIILKALRKEPARRYASVGEFSEDIRHHLKGLPVTARRDTFAYRASKFVGRNKTAVAAAAVVSLTLVGGIIATAWQAHVARDEGARAEAEKELAEKRFEEVRALAHSVMFDYHDAIAPLTGSTKVREMLVKDSLNYLDKLAQTAGDNPALQSELAAAYIRVGDVQGRPYHSNLGQTDEALSSYRKASAILEPLAARMAADANIKRDLAAAHERVGNIALRNGHWAEALRENEQALSIREALLIANPASADAKREVGDSYLYLGDAQQVDCVTANCEREALESQNKALEIRRALSEANPSDVDLLRDVAQAFTRVGFRLSTIGAMTKDEQCFRHALESQQHSLSIREKLTAADPTNATDRRNLADQYMIYAAAQIQSRDKESAFVNYRRSLEMFKALLTNDPYNSEARRDLNNIYSKLAKAYEQSGNRSAAKENYRMAAEIAEQLLSSDPTSLEEMQTLSGIYQNLTQISDREGDLSGVIANYRKVVEFDERIAAITQTDNSRFYEANSYGAMAGLYARYITERHLRPEQILQNCRHALEWHQKFLRIDQDLISKGINPKPVPIMSPSEVVRCEQAVSR